MQDIRSMTKGLTLKGIIFIACLGLCCYFFYFTPSCSLICSKNDKPSPFTSQHYQKQAGRRREYLELIMNSTDALGWGYLYNNLAPEVYCPEKVKVGTTDDGGKWMCSPENLPDECVIFALGINDRISFEEDLQEMTDKRCRVISVDSIKQQDAVIQTIQRINGVVLKVFVSAKNTNNTKTMSRILAENNVKEVEILKIDIEGGELTTMGPFLEEYTPAQILIEVHGKARQTLQLLKTISSKGYLLSHFEINGRFHKLCEYAFIHESRLERYGATLLARYL